VGVEVAYVGRFFGEGTFRGKSLRKKVKERDRKEVGKAGGGP